MALETLIYPGSSSFFPGQTPFGIYDNDYEFQEDAPKVAADAVKTVAINVGSTLDRAPA